MNLRERIIKWGDEEMGNLSLLAKSVGITRSHMHLWLHRVPYRPELWSKVEEMFLHLTNHPERDPDVLRAKKLEALKAEHKRIEMLIKDMLMPPMSEDIE